MVLGERLKGARQEAGLTLEKAAELLGTSFNTIWRYEAEQHRPSGPTLYALATLYNRPVDWFLGKEEQESEFQPQEPSIQKIEAFTLYADSNRALSAKALAAKLALKYDDPASERTVLQWYREWREEPVKADTLFDWSRLDEHGLPWEAGAYLMRMQAFVLENKHDWFLIEPSVWRQRITFRQAKWCWRLHLAVPEVCLFDVYWLAHVLWLRELTRELGGDSGNLEDIQAFLAYRPWAGVDNYDAYLRAIAKGTIPALPDSGRVSLDVNTAIRFFHTSTPQLEPVPSIGGLLFSEVLTLLMVMGEDSGRAERLVEGLPVGYFRDPKEFGALSGNDPAIQEHFVVDWSQDGYFDFTQIAKYERKSPTFDQSTPGCA